VAIWHDLLWYGHARSPDITATGFTEGQVLRDLRAQIADLCDADDPDTITLNAAYG
jgi:hypothetical protein